MSQIVDTSFLYALVNEREQRHADVLAVAANLSGSVYLPTVVVTEAGYLLRRDLGGEALAAFLDTLAQSAFQFVEPTPADFRRAAAIVRQYADSEIDLVDAVIMATAERLEITRVLTLDQRHFWMFHPAHCVAFEILP